jgi:hypothetical protein
VQVTAPPSVTVTLTANPQTIQIGNSTVLSWSSQNASFCTASGGWSGTRPVSGNESVTPLASTNYYLSCFNNFGSQAQSSATVFVNDQQPSFPSVNLSAGPSTITKGQSAILVWSSSNATSCTASGGWSGTKATSGSETVSPSSNTTYTLTCTNSRGSTSDNETIFVTISSPPNTPPPKLSAACVVSPEVARIGQTVLFAAGASGGTAPYSYLWDQDISGSGLTRTVTFDTAGVKTAQVTVTDATGKTAQGTCSVRINPQISTTRPQLPSAQLTKTESCKCNDQQNSAQLINAPACQTFTLCQQNLPKDNLVYNVETGTWNFQNENGNQNAANNKKRSFLASLLLTEQGNPTTVALLIWYLLILVVIVGGILIYRLIRSTKVK